MLKEFLKKYRDRFLFSIRKQIYDLIDENSEVVDIGCGDGELLRILSPKIKYGLGIDKNKREINFTRQLTEKAGIVNLEFKITDAKKDLKEKFDYSILMFVLHSLDYDSQIRVLSNARKNSGEIIIVDIKSSRKNLLIHLEEILTGHYKQFKTYLESGGIEGLIDSKSLERFDTCKDYIGIWKVVI